MDTGGTEREGRAGGCPEEGIGSHWQDWGLYWRMEGWIFGALRGRGGLGAALEEQGAIGAWGHRKVGTGE